MAWSRTSATVHPSAASAAVNAAASGRTSPAGVAGLGGDERVEVAGQPGHDAECDECRAAGESEAIRVWEVEEDSSSSSL